MGSMWYFLSTGQKQTCQIMIQQDATLLQ